ncbi:MAG: stage II sporulation protein P [Thermoanaerobacteraceae bacterium]|nr:stage II sporulation protein P [Thermoanaerobacteraceae bacterium]
MVKIHYVKFSTILYYAGICIFILSIVIGLRLFFNDNESLTVDNIDDQSGIFTDNMLKYFINTASPTIEVLYKESGLLPEYNLRVSLLRYVANIDLEEPLSILKNQLPVLGMVNIKNVSTVPDNSTIPEAQPQETAPVATPTEEGQDIVENEEAEAIPDKPLVLIYHTHTREAYIAKYKVDDVDRTLDPQNNVIRIGEEIKKELEKQGIPVIHDTTVYDIPYDNSYSRSNAGIKKIMEKYPTIKYVFDIHRDAFAEVITKETTEIPDPEKLLNKSFREKYVMSYDGKKIARVMWVIGTRRTDEQKEDWHLNLAFTQRLHNALNEEVPGISINVETKPYGSYNQEIQPNSTLVEVGSNHNTLDEAINSTVYVANAMAKVIKESEKRQ